MAFPDPDPETLQRLEDIRFNLLWATRRRRRFLEGAVLERAVELWVEAAESLGARVVRVANGGDHVIVTVESHPDVSPSLVVVRLKRHSASHLRREFPTLRTLPSIWTRQYLATTVDPVPPERVAAFVEGQPRSDRRRYRGPSSAGEAQGHGVEVVTLPAPGSEPEQRG